MTKKNKPKISKKKIYRRAKISKTKNKRNMKHNITLKNRNNNNYDLSKHWKKVLDISYNWQKICISNNGKYQTAIIRSKLAPDIDPNGNGNIYTSNDYGLTWKPHKDKLNLNWEGLAMNSTGKYQTAVVEGRHIYTSSDYGKNWKITNVQSNWITICMSASGKHQTVVANGFFPSDKGKGFIYVSHDYGHNWNKKTEISVSWVCAAMSSDGKHQIAGSFLLDGDKEHNFYENGYVYNSSDYGNTWTKNKSLKQSWWVNASMSGSGEIQAICAINCNLDLIPPGPIYISYDYGKTFTKAITPSEPWLVLCVSNNGKYMLAASYKQQDKDKKDIPHTGGMICSNNYGKTWEYTDAPKSNYTGVIINNTGKYAMACAWDDGIYKLF